MKNWNLSHLTLQHKFLNFCSLLFLISTYIPLSRTNILSKLHIDVTCGFATISSTEHVEMKGLLCLLLKPKANLTPTPKLWIWIPRALQKCSRNCSKSLLKFRIWNHLHKVRAGMTLHSRVIWQVKKICRYAWRVLWIAKIRQNLSKEYFLILFKSLQTYFKKFKLNHKTINIWNTELLTV